MCIRDRVSLRAARDEYGVVLDGDMDACTVSAEATSALREKLKACRRGEPPMIDRGSGFEKMLRGEVKPWTRSA